MDDIKAIKKLRKKLNLTQKELAEEAGVSQSLIAKVESGRLEPSYSKARNILDALHEKKSESELTAADMMTGDVEECRPSDNVAKVIEKMKIKEISQLPVVEGDSLVGLVSEKSLLSHVMDEDPKLLVVEDVMLNSPPTVSKKTPQSAILPLLQHFPLVAVTEKGELCGVITKADVIRHTYS